MLRIYRYLALASAIILFLTLAMVAWLYHQQTVRNLVEVSAKHNVGLNRIMLNTLWSSYGDYLISARELDGPALRARPETHEIHNTIEELSEGVHILKVKIYSRSGLTIFSSDPAQIGEDYSGSAAFMAAVRDGTSSSALTFKDRFSAFSGELFERDIVESYVPITIENGSIVGVFEVYTDVTDIKQRIDRTTFNMLAGLIAIFGTLYGVLVFWVMRRAIAPIRRASSQAAKIGPRSSGVRLPTSGMPWEILPLVTTVNSALDRLDRALDAQRRFAADSAHELLTPLAVLGAHLDTLKDKKAATALRQDVDAMTDVVHQLLDLAELESEGSVISGEEAVNLRDVCMEVTGMLAPLALRDGKQLALSGTEDTVTVKASARMLHRALRNLIENAIAHTPLGTTVEVHLDTEGTVRVTDQGPGVPPEGRDAVFQRFWRGDGSTGSGAGLGLSIVKRIVESFGGSVAVTEAPGGGACFTINLVKIEPPTLDPEKSIYPSP